MDRFVKNVALVAVVGWSACGIDPGGVAVQDAWERGLGQGSLRVTGRSLDVALVGPGFLEVHRGGEVRLTRAGALAPDDEGFLVTPGGWRVQGVDRLGRPALLRLPREALGPFPTTRVTVEANLAADAPVAPSADFDPTRPSDTSTFRTSIGSVGLEGELRRLDLYYRKEGPGLWDFFLLDEDVAAGLPTQVGGGQLRFDTQGNLVSATQWEEWEQAPGRLQPLSLNLGDPTEEGGTGSTGVTQYGGTGGVSTTTAVRHDGLPVGLLTGAFVTELEGVLFGEFSNGGASVLGQLTVARVPHPDALVRDCENRFQATALSGTPVLGAPTSDGRASVAAGRLESLPPEPLGCPAP